MTPEPHSSPAQRDGCHRHPRDAADAPPLLAAVSVTRAAVLVLVLLLRPLAPVTAVTAAVVYEEGENHEEGDHQSDGRQTGQNQQSLQAGRGGGGGWRCVRDGTLIPFLRVLKYQLVLLNSIVCRYRPRPHSATGDGD